MVIRPLYTKRVLIGSWHYITKRPVKTPQEKFSSLLFCSLDIITIGTIFDLCDNRIFLLSVCGSSGKT
jgi:hypothetical protein